MKLTVIVAVSLALGVGSALVNPRLREDDVVGRRRAWGGDGPGGPRRWCGPAGQSTACLALRWTCRPRTGSR